MSQIHIPDHQEIFCGSANAMAISAEHLFKAMDAAFVTDQSDTLKYSLGGAVLGSFAIELLFKACKSLSEKDMHFESGHRLSLQFKTLPSELRERINRKFSKHAEVVLDDYLNSHDRAFEEWRYIATGGKSKLDFDFKSTRVLLALLSEEVTKKINPNAKEI